MQVNMIMKINDDISISIIIMITSLKFDVLFICIYIYIYIYYLFNLKVHFELVSRWAGLRRDAACPPARPMAEPTPVIGTTETCVRIHIYIYIYIYICTERERERFICNLHYNIMITYTSLYSCVIIPLQKYIYIYIILSILHCHYIVTFGTTQTHTLPHHAPFNKI